MRCSIVQSTWHEFETDWTKMIAQPPRFKRTHETFAQPLDKRKAVKSARGSQAIHGRSTNDNTVIFTPFKCSDQNRASPQHLARKPFKTHTPKTTTEPSNGPITAKKRRSIERVLPPIIGSFVLSVRWRVTALHTNQRRLKVWCKFKIEIATISLCLFTRC